MARTLRAQFAASVCVVCLAAAVGAEPPANLRVVFDEGRVLGPAMRANALGEASRIWRLYGVSLTTDDDGRCNAANGHAVTVTIDADDDSQSSEAGLGAIRFAPDGSPDSTIVLNVGAVTRIATSGPVMGTHPALWPAGLRDEIVARALGRALAHELGHFLLRSPHHAKSGLMRARQEGSVLGSPNGRPFGLTSVDRARLRLALASRDDRAFCPMAAK